MTCLLCLLVLTVTPISSGQQSTAADLSRLVSDLKDKNVKVRAEAARLLTGMGNAAKPAIPALIDALEDSDAKIRYRALIALGNLWSGLESGPEIEAAVPAIAWAKALSLSPESKSEARLKAKLKNAAKQ